MADSRIIIVGAGPAGVRCAETLVEAGLRPLVIDEGMRSGGQIYRRQPANFTRDPTTLYGTETARAEAIHRAFDALRPQIDYLPETLVWNIAGKKIHTLSGTSRRSFHFDALVICAGATDRLMPVAGWTLPGVYSLGGAQVALKSQACAIGRSVAFMGSGPLLYLVAAQYAKAGADVAAVLDTSPFRRRAAALPKLAARTSVLWKGMMLNLALLRRRIPLHSGIAPLSIEGSPREGVTGIRFRDSSGRERHIACDAVGLGYHLRPETQLADLAGCAFRFDQASHQWLVEADASGRSSVPGIYLAGDGARVRGAIAAEASGRLAALTLLADVGRATPRTEITELRRELAAWDRFAAGLREAFPWPAQQAKHLDDDVIVCRCEVIRAGELRGIVRGTGAQEVNRAKAFSRVGMGRCQGRYCGHAAAEIIAHAASVPLEEVGRLRGQAPVKPFPIGTAEVES
jgi:NADPH-dependent 2,4-dienoyl-CoA reductase/sulfur reductase-like enzyme